MLFYRYSSIEADGTFKLGANVFNLDKVSNGGDENQVIGGASLISEFSVDLKDLNHVAWMPGEAGKLMVLAQNQLCFYNLEHPEDPTAIGKLEGKGLNELTTGAWNPHQNSQQFATVNEYHIRGWDVKSMKQAWTFESPGNQNVRSIDFNPNKQYHLASSGDDGAVRFWDIR